jgi:hypothetical protein
LQKAIRPVTVAFKQHLPHFPMVVSKSARIALMLFSTSGLVVFFTNAAQKIRPAAVCLHLLSRISLNPENAQGTLYSFLSRVSIRISEEEQIGRDFYIASELLSIVQP